MRTAVLATALAASGTLASRPFLEEPDTGLSLVVANISTGQLPSLSTMVGLNDFQWAASNYLPAKNYTYYRNGAGGEWSYRNNLEVYNRFRFRPRAMRDITNINASMQTTILGHNFSAPLFISPAARADYGHPLAEANLVKAACSNDVLYMPSGYAYLSWEEIRANACPGQILFQQVYFSGNDTANRALIKRAVATNASALIWSVDSPGSPTRERASRFDVGSANTAFVKNTWDIYAEYANLSSVPIVLKGIQSVDDVRAAVAHGVPAIILSNHGGRNLDGSPSSLEIALEVYKADPTLFGQIEILADGGVRFGTDALKLLALGVKAVGIGRPVMFSNVFGQAGVEKVLSLMKSEIMNDAANLGVPDLKAINSSYVEWTPNMWYS